ncbi:MAG TPA: class I SAM-dependent methyltransferase, partial [Actinomycetota bacterium]|nr:class I SAM-dependent methyltransferase [Actinomycetota bacterium]
DELRPRYAPEAVAWVVERGSLEEGSIVVDLAAGTGQLSGPFADVGAEVIAVEPAANMAAVLHDRRPSVRIEPGIAEAIPLATGTADVVVVGNAFHHFDRDRAFAEIRRVLRPGALLALFWAWPLEDEQRSIPGMEEIYEAADAARCSNEIATAYRSWAEPPPDAEGFGPFERREFRVTHVIPSSRLADLYATSSDVASLPDQVRTDLLDRIRRLSFGLPDVLHLPARSVVDLCLRR